MTPWERNCFVSEEEYIFWQRVRTHMGSDQTQIPVTEAMRDRMRFLKVMSGCSSYTDTLEMLLEDSGYDVPEQGFSPESAKEAMREMENAE